MTSRSDYFGEAQVPDIERRLASIVRVGVVEELDVAKARVRVRAGKVLTGWIPWGANRAGKDRSWSAVEKGEQVVMVAPSGDLSQAVVVTSLYRDANPAPGNNVDVQVHVWGDGARQSYDRKTHTHTLSIPASGVVVISVGQTSWTLTDGSATLNAVSTTINGRVNINGNVAVHGRMTVTEDVVAAGVSLRDHVHSGVMRGGANTDEPVADAAMD